MQNNLFGSVLGIKLELFNRAADMLPDHIRNEIRKVPAKILTEIRDGISSCLDRSAGKNTEETLKKIELD